MDTWHPGKSGNMWEMGQREMAPGYDAEKLLFNAHEKRGNVFAALEKISSVISAEKAGFWIVGQGYDEDVCEKGQG